MSVVIVVKVSEGLVLGADSAATIRGRAESPMGTQEGILKTYYNARKLLQIGDFPIGVLTWGHSFIGSRTIESLVREWEYEQHWQSRDDHEEQYRSPEYYVSKCANGLLEQIGRVYIDEFGSEGPMPRIGFIVAGYSYRTFFPKVFRFVLPDDLEGGVHDLRPDVDDKPDFGANWYGLTDSIVRLHFGRDPKAIQFIAEKYDIPREELVEALAPLQYTVPFAVMPLQDAIEYTKYMLNVAVGRYRFVVGPELCGGEIEIAAITQRQFQWISRKTWSLEE